MAVLMASNLGLVPQRRLGALLADRREQYGYSVSDMAIRSMGRFTPDELDAIEAGNVTLDDVTVEALGLLFEFNSTPPTQQRSKLIIADDEEIPISLVSDGHSDDMRLSVLQRYVALLYLLRNAEVGERLSLRRGQPSEPAGPPAAEARLLHGQRHWASGSRPTAAVAGGSHEGVRVGRRALLLLRD